MLSILRWAHNPASRLSGFRVAQLIPGIGPVSATRLLDAMAQSATPAQVLAQFKPRRRRPPTGVRSSTSS
jgi:DNA helicase-2/ATP-dependent DNA helicase PcrA